jgi:hypothetical protein
MVKRRMPAFGATAREQSIIRPRLERAILCSPLALNAPSELVTGAPLDVRRVNSEFARDRMIRKLAAGKYRLYSREKNPKTGKRRNLGTFDSRAAAEKHERAVQYFKRH